LTGQVKWRRDAANSTPLSGAVIGRSSNALPLGMSPRHGPCQILDVAAQNGGLSLILWRATLDVNGRRLEVAATEGPVFLRDAGHDGRFRHSPWLLNDEVFNAHIRAVNRHQEGTGSAVTDTDKFLWALKVGHDRWRECEALAALGTVLAHVTSAGARRELIPEPFTKDRIREIESAHPGWIVLNEYLEPSHA
jgi:hypothetical protein